MELHTASATDGCVRLIREVIYLRTLRSVECCQLLLEHGASVHYVPDNEDDGFTILHWAVSEELELSAGDLEVLLKAGADPNIKTRMGYTPLHILARDREIGDHDNAPMTMLLDHGADVNARDDDGMTPLHHIMYHCGVGIDLLCARGADVNARDHLGQTSLHTLVRYGFAYNGLIDCGADVNAQDNDGNTPLHVAVVADLASERAYIVEVVEWLFRRGADSQIKNRNAATALDIVLELEDLLDMERNEASLLVFEFVKDFLNNNNMKAATALVADPRTERNQTFQNLNDPLNLEDHYKDCVRLVEERGEQYIHRVVLIDDLEAVTNFIQANPQSVTARQFGITPLHLASSEEMAHLLIAHGADVNAIGWLGRFVTPLYSPRIDLVRVLLKHGADVNICDAGATRLHYAAQYNEVQVVEALLAAGANIEARDKDLRTPLHWAVEHGNLEIVELLIENYADVSALDKQDFTPLIVAINNEHYHIEEILKLNIEELSMTNMDYSIDLEDLN